MRAFQMGLKLGVVMPWMKDQVFAQGCHWQAAGDRAVLSNVIGFPSLSSRQCNYPRLFNSPQEKSKKYNIQLSYFSSTFQTKGRKRQ
jgi:hypothetical protein